MHGKGRKMCKHITDPDLIEFYVDRPELTCARCWVEGL
jgi:hypothetical protein